MATLTQRTAVVEERTETLETILAAFMARTDEVMIRQDEAMTRHDEAMARQDEAMTRHEEAIGRLERIIERREQEGAREREEAARDRKEMREQAEHERREMNKRWGNLANKMGTLVEDIIAPSIRRLAREVFGCGDQRYFGTRVSVNRSDDPSREREFDALYVGARAVLLNETKSSPRSEHVQAFVQFLESGEFALYFPQYRELPIKPAFSSLSIPPDMVTYLTRRGIYAIAMGEEAMQVLNLEAVRSRR